MSEGSSLGSPPSSLVERLKNRQAEAWQSFVRLYGPLVYSWCRTRWRLQPQDAAEVLQDVVSRVLESIAAYRGENFVSWLWAVTRSRAANFLKANPDRAEGGSDAQQRMAELPDIHVQETAGSGQEVPVADQLQGVLGRALERVQSRAAASSWKAFWQVTVEGRKPADVAADLGLSVNAVYVASSRILSRLRQELAITEEG
jgi:RNA polymerase sigma-70 factor (ECF subfamily)